MYFISASLFDCAGFDECRLERSLNIALLFSINRAPCDHYNVQIFNVFKDFGIFQDVSEGLFHKPSGPVSLNAVSHLLAGEKSLSSVSDFVWSNKYHNISIAGRLTLFVESIKIRLLAEHIGSKHA